MKRMIVLIVTFIFIAPVFGADVVAVHGTVASTGGKPVSGAVVLQRESGLKTTTGEDGSFSLELERSGRTVLEVIHPDYSDGLFLLPAKSLDRPVRLTLAPLIQQNEEVVVTALRYPEPTARIPDRKSVV